MRRPGSSKVGEIRCRSGLDEENMLNNYINSNIADGIDTDYKCRQE